MSRTRQERKVIRVLSITLMLLALVLGAWTQVNAETAIPVSAKINAESGANIRKKASTTSKIVAYRKDNKSIKINYEIFLTAQSTKAKKIWYNVTVGKTTGFIRKDLVDSYKYTAVSGKTSDALNYRVGAGADMKKVGTLKKGAKVSIVGIAYAKSTADKWYKIKKGKKYYYVSAYWVDLTTVDSPGTPVTLTPTPEPSTPEEKASFTTTGVTKPTTVALGCKYSIAGTVECNLDMSEVKVGVMNTSNKWETSKTLYSVGKTFDISTVDQYIKFGKLAVGSYQYRVLAKVNGEWHDVVGARFKIAKITKWSDQIGNVAVSLCWPEGTEAASYTRDQGGTPTADYQAALTTIYPSTSTSNYGVGADCGKFVSVVCRYGGYDADFPSDLTKMRAYLPSSDKWQEVDYTYTESELQHGDVISLTNNRGNRHVCMYVVINGVGRIAEASNTQGRFAFINTDMAKILSKKRAPEIKVYRAVS